jgi:hypothetical protein
MPTKCKSTMAPKKTQGFTSSKWFKDASPQACEHQHDQVSVIV